jgi:hypothetical protein
VLWRFLTPVRTTRAPRHPCGEPVACRVARSRSLGFTPRRGPRGAIPRGVAGRSHRWRLPALAGGMLEDWRQLRPGDPCRERWAATPARLSPSDITAPANAGLRREPTNRKKLHWSVLSPSVSKVRVRLLSGGPGVKVDFARLIFHVPMHG